MEHRAVLRAYVARYFLQSEDAEDILQETLVRSLEAEQDRQILSPKSYLFITARNLIFRQLKRQSREIVREISEIDESFLVSSEVPLDIQLHDKRKLSVFIEAANSLPRQCRRVFLMRKLYGLSHKVIAKELNISTSTVERHISNAIKRCQLLMKKKGYDATMSDPATARKRMSDHGSK